jgi:hypothetical protein
MSSIAFTRGTVKNAACHARSQLAELCSGAQQVSQIQAPGHHRESTGGVARPLIGWPIPAEFDPILIRIPQIERLAHPVIGGSVQSNAGGVEPPQGVGQGRPGGIKNRCVKKSGGAAGGRGPARTLPCVQTDVIVVTPGGNEGGL